MARLEAGSTVPPLELWVGPECTVNRVGDRWRDQSALTGFDSRTGDVERLASLGAKRIRFPVLWEKAAALPGPLNFSWADARLGEISSAGLEPIIGLLHHGSGPRHTSLVDPLFPVLFADYACQVAKRYPYVRSWTPINEPLTTARFSCLYGLWYPHASDDSSFVRALMNQVKATSLAMAAIRSVIPNAELIQTDDLGFTRSTPALVDQADFDNERRWLAFDLLCGRVDQRHPLHGWLCACGADAQELRHLNEFPCPPSIVGVNAYITSERFLDERLELHPPHLHGGNGRQAYADVETVRAHGGMIDGFGARLREAHQRFGLPVAITEVHMGCTREEQMRWLHRAWEAALSARAEGVDVRGLTAWAAFGTVDWSSLLTREIGHYEPGLWDARSDPPRLTGTGKLARALGHGQMDYDAGLTSLLEGPGWWERDLRHNVTPYGDVHASLPNGASLLVLGDGALARAFARLAHMRGLPYERLERPWELEPIALQDALQSHEIWAVIDASGQERVRRLLETCGLTSVRTLLVDETSTLQGSKLPTALHIHTGTLFGPWNGSADLLATGLACVAGTRAWPTSFHEVVTPTYIPDLVQCALDLLVDDETGHWWVSHGESMSCYDFACRAEHLHKFGACALPAPREDVLRETFFAAQALKTGYLPSLDDALLRYRQDYEPDKVEPPALRVPRRPTRAMTESGRVLAA